MSVDPFLPQDNLRDPFQGFDIDVTVFSTGAAGGVGANDPVLEGSFTGFMCRIQCQTEAYLALNQRVPRMLDGEYITTWMLEQGFQMNSPVAQTFGKPFAAAFAQGRSAPIPRTRRLHIGMRTLIPDTMELGEAVFATELTDVKMLQLTLKLYYGRIDNGNFGVTAGKRVASSAWQGTAEYVDVQTGQATTEAVTF